MPVAQALSNRQHPQVTNRRRSEFTSVAPLDPSHLNRLVTGVRFEKKKYGFDLYWNPTGERGRSHAIYFGRLGKRLLQQIGAGPAPYEQIRQVVLSKMAEKGLR